MISVVIDGSVQKGVGGASSALPKQWPELVVRFPEIKDAYQGGTINVQLFVPLLVMNPDCAIPPYDWAGTEILEGFGIVRIKFSCPVDIDPVNAWIYLPERSPTDIVWISLRSLLPRLTLSKRGPRVGSNFLA